MRTSLTVIAVVSLTNCPLCTDSYEMETDLRVHLEVEHRKSELVAYVVDRSERRAEPTVEPDRPVPSA